MQLVKQAHFLMLVARDLQSDIGEKCCTVINVFVCYFLSDISLYLDTVEGG